MDAIYDAAVIGLGPAGAQAAYRLSREGLSVLALEKKTLPRHKLCAGGITAKTVDLLDFDFSEAVEQQIEGAYVCYRHSEIVEMPYGGPSGYVVNRPVFDRLLAERASKAGAEVRTGETLLAVAEKDDVIELKTGKGTRRCKRLIGADGAHGVTARHLGRSLRPQAIGIQVHVPDDFTIIRDNTHRLAIYFGDLPDGYGWIFPRKNGASVGICVTAKHARRGRTLLSEFLGTLKLPAELAHTAKGHAIPFYSPMPRMTYCRRGILLAGDAACFVDPITGEGIYYALKSAQAAAEALIRTPANESPAWIYNQALQQDVIRELNAAWKIAKPLYAFPGASFIAFRNHARLREMYFDILAGRASYADLLSEAPRATLPMLKSLLARII